MKKHLEVQQYPSSHEKTIVENVYEAMESAGLRLEDMKGSNTSVFAGVFTDDTRMILNEDPE